MNDVLYVWCYCYNTVHLCTRNINRKSSLFCLITHATLNVHSLLKQRNVWNYRRKSSHAEQFQILLNTFKKAIKKFLHNKIEKKKNIFEAVPGTVTFFRFSVLQQSDFVLFQIVQKTTQYRDLNFCTVALQRCENKQHKSMTFFSLLHTYFET